MDIGEFIDTYSDDLIYLHEARVALRTHPLRGDYAFAEYLDASFCRMLAVFMIGSIEVMLATSTGLSGTTWSESMPTYMPISRRRSPPSDTTGRKGARTATSSGLATENTNDSSTSPHGVPVRRTTNCLPSTAIWPRKHSSSGVSTGSGLSLLAACTRNVSNVPFRCWAVPISTQRYRSGRPSETCQRTLRVGSWTTF